VAAGDLTDLTTVRAHLGLNAEDTGSDSLLTTYITAASARFVTEAGRPVLKDVYTDTFDGDGKSRTHVLRYGPVEPASPAPVVSVDGVTVDAAVGQGDGWYLLDDRILLRNLVWTDGVGNCAITYTAGFTAAPAEVAFACVELVAWWYRGRDHIGLASRTVGGEPQAYQGTWASEQAQGGLPASFLAVVRGFHWDKPGV
jgi:hypothetical protein